MLDNKLVQGLMHCYVCRVDDSEQVWFINGLSLQTFEELYDENTSTWYSIIRKCKYIIDLIFPLKQKGVKYERECLDRAILMALFGLQLYSLASISKGFSFAQCYFSEREKKY